MNSTQSNALIPLQTSVTRSGCYVLRVRCVPAATPPPEPSVATLDKACDFTRCSAALNSALRENDVSTFDGR